MDHFFSWLGTWCGLSGHCHQWGIREGPRTSFPLPDDILLHLFSLPPEFWAKANLLCEEKEKKNSTYTKKRGVLTTGSKGRVGMGLLSLWTWKGLLYPTMTLSPNSTLSTNLTPPAKMISTQYRWLEPVKICISTVNLSFFQGSMNIQQVGSLSLKNRGQRDASITKGVGMKFLQGFRFWRPSVMAG